MTLLHQMAEIVRDLRELNLLRGCSIDFRQTSKNKIVFIHGSYLEDQTIQSTIEEAFNGYKIDREVGAIYGYVTYTISVQ